MLKKNVQRKKSLQETKQETLISWGTHGQSSVR